jgi:hypothetical protein
MPEPSLPHAGMIRRIYTSYLSNAGSPSFMKGPSPTILVWRTHTDRGQSDNKEMRSDQGRLEGSSVRRFSLPLSSSHSSNPFLGASNSHRSSGTFNKAYVSLNKRPCDVTNRQLAPFPVQSVRRQRSGSADGRADLNHRDPCAYKSSGFKLDLHLSIKQRIQQF